jgi:hypothetical protein
LLEAILKIIAFGPRYFKESWNVFDLVVSLISVAGIVVEKVLQVDGASSTNIIRSMRIVRIFKIFKKQKSLRIIFDTFIVTFPSLVNVGGLLLLLVYMYAVLGMNIFAEIQFNGEVKPLSHF